MGIFDGVLICSDIDGTLTDGGIIPEENVKYIRYFMDNGGLFTVSTGRYPGFITENNFPVMPNTYTVVVNGTVISTMDESEILYNEKLPMDFAGEIVGFVKASRLDFNYRACDISHQENILNAPVDYDTNKIVFIANAESDALEMMHSIQEKFKGKVHVSRSWHTGVEVIPHGTGKGVCVQKLKEITGSKLLICTGDFENDIDMIKAADIGYAVGNAADSVKQAADRITVANTDSALAEIIKITEKELKKVKE